MKIVDLLARSFARVWPLGLVPVAPGTAGSVLATVLAPYLFLPLGYGSRVAVLTAIYLLGALAADRTEKLLGVSDPGGVIIDEVVGQWVTFLPFAALRPWELLAGLVLFRAFDILKPWPVRSSEHWFAGGVGIMVDDLLAGAYAALSLMGVILLFE
jgi:phosphatidylglycerophosphatase A